jgi:glycosidase
MGKAAKNRRAKPSAHRAGRRPFLLLAAAIPFFLALFPASLISHVEQIPAIERIEPPDWWPGHSINPLRLLIYGRNLLNVSASTDHPGVRVLNITSNPSGNHAFITLDVSADAQPGAFDIILRAGGGEVRGRFELKEKLSSEGRFAGFSPDDVIYLIMTDRFSDGDQSNNDPPESRGLYSRSNPRGYHGGDFQGIIERLGYLKDLGVTSVWITPVYDNTNRARDFDWGRNVTDYHGYGAIDFYRVEEHSGDVEKLKELVDRAHALGLKVIQDQVANHTGPDHRWAVAPPTATWLNGTPSSHLNNVFDIKSITEENPNRERKEATLRGWFADILPDINQDDAESAAYLIQNAAWWIGSAGIDGIRQDTFPYAPRRFWSDWNQSLERELPRLKVVGEVFDSRPEVVSFFQGGRPRFDGIDSRLHTVFDFPSYFAIRDVFIKGQAMTRLSDVISQDNFYTDARALVTFLGNHDVARFMSQPGAGVSSLKLAFTYLLTMRGVPQIFYGDEIGMKGGDDPDNRRDFPGGFPGDQRNAFTSSGRRSKERKIFNHVRDLLRMRAEHVALRQGSMRVLSVTDTTIAYLRETERERVMVLINNSDRTSRIEVSTTDAAINSSHSWAEIAPIRDAWRGRSAGSKLTVSLKPHDWKIILQK